MAAGMNARKMPPLVFCSRMVNRASSRPTGAPALPVLLAVLPGHVVATPLPQSADQRAAIQHALDTQFRLTKTTADRSDIVTAGSVLVLHKDGLVMCSLDTPAPPTSTYKGGKLGMGFGATLSWNMQLGGDELRRCAAAQVCGGREILGHRLRRPGRRHVFNLYSDPYQDVRYYGNLKVAFGKHSMPPADEVLKTVAEVITAKPDEQRGTKRASTAGASSRQSRPWRPSHHHLLRPMLRHLNPRPSSWA